MGGQIHAPAPLPTLPIEQEGKWAPELWRTENSLEIFVLLWCYAASIGSYRRFGKTIRPDLKGLLDP